MLGTNQVLAKVPHLLAEVWSRRPHSKAKSEKSGFPLEEHEEHEDGEDGEHACLNHNLLLQSLRFRAMSSKTWTLVPILEDHMKTNTKICILIQIFGSKHGFLQEDMNSTFSF